VIDRVRRPSPEAEIDSSLRSDLAAAVETLRNHGARFRNDIVVGVGGKQILLEDPSGNPIELFEPTLPEALMSPHR
jgi:hypothetical protein